MDREYREAFPLRPKFILLHAFSDLVGKFLEDQQEWRVDAPMALANYLKNSLKIH